MSLERIHRVLDFALTSLLGSLLYVTHTIHWSYL